jgi:hypothetical protein
MFGSMFDSDGWESPQVGLLGRLRGLNNPQRMGLLGAAASVLQASAPSTAPKSFGGSLGAGLMGGLGGLQQGQRFDLLNQEQQLKAAQMQEMQRKGLAAGRQEAALAAFAESLSPEERQKFMVDPGEYLKAINKRYTVGNSLVSGAGQPIYEGQEKPALVEVPVPGQPGTTQPTWVRPGEPTGTQVGGVKSPSDPNSFREFELAKKDGYTGTYADWMKLRTPQTSINMSEDAFAKTAGKMSAERMFSEHDNAQKAVEGVAKTGALLRHLRTSDAITGMGADFFTTVKRAQTLFTQDKAAGKQVSDTQILDAFLGSDVFPMIGALGIGARGLDTPAEREYLRKVMTGTIEMDKDALIKLTQIRRDIGRRMINQWNKKVERGELDEYFKQARIPKSKIDLPADEDAEDWISRAMNANMISRAQAIAEGKKRGKVPEDY